MISQQEKSKKKRIAAQTWYLEHGEQARANNRKWVRENPEKNAAKANRRRVRKFGAAGSHTEAEWQILKRQYGNRCVGCRKTETELKAFGRRLVRDHIVALARGGTDDITNIQPLCHGIDGCNNKKHAKFHDFIIS